MRDEFSVSRIPFTAEIQVDGPMPIIKNPMSSVKCEILSMRRSMIIALLAVSALACAPMSLLSTPTPTPTSMPVFQGPMGIATATPTPTVPPIALPSPLPTATLLPTVTPSTPWLTGEVRVYPGPLHYAGDVVSVEVAIENSDKLENAASATLAVDDKPLPQTQPFIASSPLRDSVLVFRWAWDTADQVGLHKLTVSVPINDQAAPAQLVTHVEVLPADDRPAQEHRAAWSERIIPCCRIVYITRTAAARDINRLAEEITGSIAAVESKVGFPVSGKPIPITLIDNVWGNGAFASNELVISTVDRDYVSSDIDITTRHEGVHYAMSPLGRETPTLLVEGVAVYVAGGHYKPEPIPERAAALLALDHYIPLAALAEDFYSHQHEIAYLEAAGLVHYLTETYGWSEFVNLYSTEGLETRDARWLDQALDLTYGKSLGEIEADYKSWLKQYSPGDQIEDLRLTIELFDTMRRYQAAYAPYQESLPTTEEARVEGQIAEFVREPAASENIALETLLAQAGQDLRQGNYTSCAAELQILNQVLEDGDFTLSPISDYLAIARLLNGEGYEAQHVDILGNRATVQAIRTWPRLDVLTLVRDGSGWQIEAATAAGNQDPFYQRSGFNFQLPARR